MGRVPGFDELLRAAAAVEKAKTAPQRQEAAARFRRAVGTADRLLLANGVPWIFDGEVVGRGVVLRAFHIDRVEHFLAGDVRAQVLHVRRSDGGPPLRSLLGFARPTLPCALVLDDSIERLIDEDLAADSFRLADPIWEIADPPRLREARRRAREVLAGASELADILRRSVARHEAHHLHDFARADPRRTAAADELSAYLGDLARSEDPGLDLTLLVRHLLDSRRRESSEAEAAAVLFEELAGELDLPRGLGDREAVARLYLRLVDTPPDRLSAAARHVHQRLFDHPPPRISAVR
jgi:hypothetical protein